MANAITGNTGAIVFGTSGFTAKYRILGEVEQERPKLNESALDTADYEEYIPGDLAEPGELQIEFYFNPQDTPPDVLAAAETVTLTLPLKTTGNTAATLAGTGFITKRTIAPNLQNNEVAIGKATIAWDGGTGPTFTAEASP